MVDAGVIEAQRKLTGMYRVLLGMLVVQVLFFIVILALMFVAASSVDRQVEQTIAYTETALEEVIDDAIEDADARIGARIDSTLADIRTLIGAQAETGRIEVVVAEVHKDAVRAVVWEVLAGVELLQP